MSSEVEASESETEGLSEEQFMHLSTVDPDIVSDICEELDLSEEVTDAAEEFAHAAWVEHPINAAAKDVAAGAVYLAAFMKNEKRVQEDVADAAGTSVRQVRTYYRKIGVHEGILEPRENDSEREERSGFAERVTAALKEVLGR